ncbi:MAG: signal peptidase I [Oscillospiraceae bacterium]|nr:signal peptidase I [Oscillospiraceae bacterium]
MAEPSERKNSEKDEAQTGAVSAEEISQRLKKPTKTSLFAALEEQEAKAEEASSAEEEKEPYSVKNFLGDVLDMIESVIASIFVVMLVYAFLYCTANVEGTSMVPTLKNGDRLVVSRLSKDFETGDILILNNNAGYTLNAAGEVVKGPGIRSDGKDKRIVKRLIAQSGQQVNIDFIEGIVYVDGKALEEPYTNCLSKQQCATFDFPLTVPEGYVFVLGDNREVSLDSRDPRVGLVPRSEIVGKVILRITPFSKFGFVK